ncbi:MULTISPECIES: flagellar export chaperone FliS [Paenibacillus]|nr:flagellar export chaperone FliS [Paenibacillus anaericanus]
MQMPYQTGYKAYQRNKYETASPHRLILMLFNGAIQFVNQAQTAISEGNNTEGHRLILRTQDIIYELISSLKEDQGGEIAKNLKGIYLYIIDRLVQANLNKQIDYLVEVNALLSDLKSAWEQIGKEGTLG